MVYITLNNRKIIILWVDFNIPRAKRVESKYWYCWKWFRIPRAKRVGFSLFLTIFLIFNMVFFILYVFMYIHIYIYTYIYQCFYKYTSIYIYIYIYIYWSLESQERSDWDSLGIVCLCEYFRSWYHSIFYIYMYIIIIQNIGE